MFDIQLHAGVSKNRSLHASHCLTSIVFSGGGGGGGYTLVAHVLTLSCTKAMLDRVGTFIGK